MPLVLGCSDSRVPIEIVFDQGPGDIFSIRVAGSVADSAALGSVQYAVRHLKVHLDHGFGPRRLWRRGCRPARRIHARPGTSRACARLLDLIVPSLQDLPPIRDSKARMREAVTRNVWEQKAALERDPN